MRRCSQCLLPKTYPNINYKAIVNGKEQLASIEPYLSLDWQDRMINDRNY